MAAPQTKKKPPPAMVRGPDVTDQALAGTLPEDPLTGTGPRDLTHEADPAVLASTITAWRAGKVADARTTLVQLEAHLQAKHDAPEARARRVAGGLGAGADLLAALVAPGVTPSIDAVKKQLPALLAALKAAEVEEAASAEGLVLGVKPLAALPSVDLAVVSALRAALVQDDDGAAADAALADLDRALNTPELRRARAAARRRALEPLAAQLEAAPHAENAERIRGEIDAGLEAARLLLAPPPLNVFDEMDQPEPDVPWLNRGLGLGLGRPNMCLGYAGSGKTYSMVAAATAMVLGRSAWGCPDFRAQRPAVRLLYVDLDMGESRARRRLRWTLRGFDLSAGEKADARDAIVVVRDTEPLKLQSVEPAEVSRFRRAWARVVRGFDLVLVDSYRGATPGMDESAPSASLAASSWADVSEDDGRAVFWVARHTKKAATASGPPRPEEQEGSGSAAIDGQSGSQLLIKRDPRVSLEQAKKGPRFVSMVRDAAEVDGSPYPEHYLRLELDRDAHSARVVYLTPEQVHPPGDVITRSAADLAADVDAVLRAAATLARTGHKMGGIDAVKHVQRGKHGRGMGHARAREAVDYLFDEKLIDAKGGPFMLTPAGLARAEGRS